MRMSEQCPQTGLHCPSRAILNVISDAALEGQVKLSTTGAENNKFIRGVLQVLRRETVHEVEDGLAKVDNMLHEADIVSQENLFCQEVGSCIALVSFAVQSVNEVVPHTTIDYGFDQGDI